VNEQIPAGWYTDPSGRHEHRYWDGVQWTHHVGSQGRQGIDAPVADSLSPSQAQGQPASPVRIDTSDDRATPPRNRTDKKVQRQLRKLGVAGRQQAGDSALFTEPVLVVNQKGKLFEVNAQYDVFDQHGQQIGAVQEVGQSVMKKAMAPSNRTRRLQVVDMNGRELLALTQPTRLVNAKMMVRSGDGTHIGQISQKLSFSYVRFRLEADGQVVGSIKGENRRESDFSIEDAAASEIGRITRTGAGLTKEMFTKADNYVVEIHRTLEEPLRSLVIAAALAVDTALRQT
jgi:uncharacterized protein YxjI